LQLSLRQVAAERDWQPLHTPKNLAMALMVEAAELAGMFQWLTPEQSLAVQRDTVLQSQVADELADVLLYLVQLADHTGIELEHATERKLARNASRHPPARPGLPVGAALATPVVETHVLVDWENVQPGDADIRALVPDVTDLWLFHGPSQKHVGEQHTSFGDRVTPVKIARAGKNALDFHLSFYTGYIAARHPDARFVVLSNDKGYAPMIEHAAELGFATRQLGFGARAAAGRSPSRRGAAPKTPAAKVTRGKRVAAAQEAAPAGVAVKKVAAKKVAPAKSAPRKRPAAAKKTAAQPDRIATEPNETPVASKPAARKRPAATAKTSDTASPAATRAASPAGHRASAPGAGGVPDRRPSVGLAKAVEHVVASLRKTRDKPTRQARLLTTIRSLLGASIDEATVMAVLGQLIERGLVVVDPKGAVRFAL
jgi:NTP pyrophosphatase (non-canonical NTP hydrolase)